MTAVVAGWFGTNRVAAITRSGLVPACFDMQDYHRLQVWEKAHTFALDVHRVSSGFPRRSGAVLATQLQRASLSVPSNIVEGAGKSSDKEFRRFLGMAMSSANEADYHLLVARDRALIGRQTYDDLTSRLLEVRRMLGGFMRRLTQSIDSSAQEKSQPNKPSRNTKSPYCSSPTRRLVDGRPPEEGPVNRSSPEGPNAPFVSNPPLEKEDVPHME